jgi:pyruvate dehydrogenase E2 component (dihydrolipoamide acetyltransferase)
MPIEFTMPKLGLTMEEGTILEWMVAAGTAVTPGTAVLMVETDKVETEVEVPEGGHLHILGEVGSTYRCGERIGWILAEGELPPTGASPAAEAAVSTGPAATAVSSAPVAVPTATKGDGGRLPASPFAHQRAKQLGIDIHRVTGTGPGGRVVSEDVELAAASAPVAIPAPAAAADISAAAQAATPARRGAAPATFAALEFARLVGIDLSRTAILPTSSDGRISRQDVADHVRSIVAGGSPATTQISFAPLLQEPASVVPLRGMRGTIANRMRASLQEMAQLTLMMDVDMDAVVADRNARKTAGAGPVPGYTDYVIAASARALREHPRVNSQVTTDGIAVLPYVNVGMAVALDEGLVVPVVQNTDQLSLEALTVETTRLAEGARKGGLKLPDLEGGTFSVTALGSYGVDGFTPVINPPNAAILGVGRLRDDVAWSDEGAIRRVRRLTLSLTWDHRVLDGAPAAEFVRTIGRFLDDPSTLS